MFPFSDNNPTKRWAVVNYTIIAVNLLVFVWWLRLPDENKLLVVLHHGFIPARVFQLSDPELDVQIQLTDDTRPQALGEPAREAVITLKPEPNEIYLSALTCMFLHGGWMHVIGNMWFLFVFGNNIEDRLGHFLYVGFYLLGGLVATVCHWAIGPHSSIPVIGASGAVAAVLGAYAITFPWAKVKTLIVLVFFITVMELPALVVLGFWFVAQLFSAMGTIEGGIDGNVAWWAHIGGFLAGVILMPVLSSLVSPPRPEPVDPWQDPGRDRFQIES